MSSLTEQALIAADEEGDIILQAAAFEEFVETVELDVRKPDARGITGDEIDSIHNALVLEFAIMRQRTDSKRRCSAFQAASIQRLSQHWLARRWGPKILFV